MSAFCKDILREIKKSFGRFFAIFAISAIGVAFFAGITGTPVDMKYSADKYFDDSNMMDISVIAPLGFSDEDIEYIGNIEGVEDIYATNEFDTLANIGSKQVVVKLTGYLSDSNINNLTLVEGRFPENSDECVILYDKFGKYNLKVGEEINVYMPSEGTIDYMLKNSSLKIVGIVKSSYYLSYDIGTSTIGDGNVGVCAYVPDENFLLPNPTHMYLTVEGAKEFNSYKDEYFDVIDPVKEKIEDYSEQATEKLDFQGADWYVLDRNEHYSYVDYCGAADRIEAIAKVFPVFFIIVAVLVCLTTMTRMVDENRGVIGTYKALGYSNIKISLKYIVYSLVASVLGGIAGAVLGMYIFPLVIYNSWNIMYVMPAISFKSQIPLVIVSVLTVTLAIEAATVWACISELVETPALLMRPKSPKMGKKIFLQNIKPLWNKMTFSQKVTARNLFRYKKRFFMTVIGISGCTALLVAGYGINDSISGLIHNQFEVVFNYDGLITYNEDSDVKEKVAANDGISDTLPITKLNATFAADSSNEDGTVYLLDCDSEYDKFITLKKRGSKEKYELKPEGAVISEKLSNDLKLKVGDTITVRYDDRKYSFEITDICEMYIGHYVFIDRNAFAKEYGSELSYNTSLIKIKKGAYTNQVMNELSSMTGVNSVTLNEGLKDRFENMISALGLVTIVLLVAAGSLAFVVLYNLTNVNVSERLREIATIKVLGFYDKEVAEYVYRENVVLTLIGGLVGLFLGTALHAFIMKVVELDGIMFGRQINVSSFLLSYGITILFSLLVNAVMYKKLKNIPMVESLKSVE